MHVYSQLNEFIHKETNAFTREGSHVCLIPCIWSVLYIQNCYCIPTTLSVYVHVRTCSYIHLGHLNQYTCTCTSILYWPYSLWWYAYNYMYIHVHVHVGNKIQYMEKNALYLHVHVGLHVVVCVCEFTARDMNAFESLVQQCGTFPYNYTCTCSLWLHSNHNHIHVAYTLCLL